ncbi:hypothetical protein MSG28_008239 [Choristoneura fumiferana]|uniref:Uncharacterized protein n=1 Tax=Choristoneura fumiferana TaxID=7141 RepID=A0ACC0JAQ7_CHOFU|nr:hypothetical protein MSG28_008239 [Choristoneura fumiferana]
MVLVGVLIMVGVAWGRIGYRNYVPRWTSLDQRLRIYLRHTLYTKKDQSRHSW